MLTIKYGVIQPPEPKEPRLPCSLDMFVFIMTRAFPDGPPWDLDKSHIERLEGIRATFPESNVFGELAIAIKRWGMIRVWQDDVSTETKQVSSETDND